MNDQQLAAERREFGLRVANAVKDCARSEYDKYACEDAVVFDADFAAIIEQALNK